MQLTTIRTDYSFYASFSTTATFAEFTAALTEETFQNLKKFVCVEINFSDGKAMMAYRTNEKEYRLGNGDYVTSVDFDFGGYGFVFTTNATPEIEEVQPVATTLNFTPVPLMAGLETATVQGDFTVTIEKEGRRWFVYTSEHDMIDLTDEPFFTTKKAARQCAAEFLEWWTDCAAA